VPFLAQTLADFVPLTEILEVIHAILVVFSDEGNRRTRLKARMKFVVERLGIERFREEVAAARMALTEVERLEAALERWIDPADRERVEADLRGEIHKSESTPIATPESNGDPILALWLARNVRAHKDPSRALVTVPLPLGDIDAPRLRGLAAIVERASGDVARATIGQNVILPEVARTELPRLFRDLAALGLAGTDTDTAHDVVSCPGADSCGLAVTASKKLAAAIREELAPIVIAQETRPERERFLDGVTIRVSGCPNACGQHHVGQIGLHGVAKKIGTKLVPHYQLHLGGRIGGGSSALGQPLVKIPARKVPGAVRALLEAYGSDRAPGQAFPDWASALATERLEEILAPHSKLEPDELKADGRKDWGSDEDFTTDDVQSRYNLSDPGEDRFLHAETEIDISEVFLGRGQTGDALAQLYRGVLSIARVLLEPLRKRPDSDRETIGELRAHVIDRGHASDAWNDLYAQVRRLRERKEPDPADVRAAQREARHLLVEAREVYPRLAAIAGRGATHEIPG
jgi:dissimilatory sulfite reductase (desulfoviridin) alpha/beta subunit